VADPVKLGVGLKEGERWHEFWFLTPVAAATTLDKYEAFLIVYMQERIMELSPASMTQIYQFVRDEEFEIWYMPQDWFGDNTFPVTYQALPKEWVTVPGMEISIAPTFESNGGVKIIRRTFGAPIDGTRVPNPENPDGFVIITNVTEEELPLVARPLANWENTRQLQEQFN
jgi:hypothetical protein